MTRKEWERARAFRLYGTTMIVEGDENGMYLSVNGTRSAIYPVDSFFAEGVNIYSVENGIIFNAQIKFADMKAIEAGEGEA